MATLGAHVFEHHTRLVVSAVRNGAVADVARTARESSVNPRFYFRGVRSSAALAGDVGNRAPPCPAVVILEAQIRAAFGVNVEANVAARVAAGAAAVPPVTPDVARPICLADPTIRLEAISVGSVHAALVCSYQVSDADLVLTESGSAIFALTPPAAAATDAAYVALVSTLASGWVVSLASGHDMAAADFVEAASVNMAALSPAEADLAFHLLTIGIASPVRAGGQLFEDNHHYHSDANSSARHRAIEREVLATLSADAMNIWRANTAVIRNCVWHAAIHVIIVGVLQGFAEDNGMPARLDATGFGTFSIGLPAQEDLLTRANTYISCLNAVLSTATAHGHRLSFANLAATRDALAGLPRTGALPALRPALPGLPAAAWPTGCDSRAKALKIFLEPALDAADPVAAWVFSFYREIANRAGIRASTPEGSLLRSYSLKRAVTRHLGDANQAAEMFAARARYIRSRADQGELETYVGTA